MNTEMNYSCMSEEGKAKYDQTADKIYALNGVALYDGNEPYIELRQGSYSFKTQVLEILEDSGYRILREFESEGSDYTAYYFFFDNK